MNYSIAAAQVKGTFVLRFSLNRTGRSHVCAPGVLTSRLKQTRNSPDSNEPYSHLEWQRDENCPRQ